MIDPRYFSIKIELIVLAVVVAVFAAAMMHFGPSVLMLAALILLLLILGHRITWKLIGSWRNTHGGGRDED